MGPALFIMAIMGCGEGDLPCEQVRTLEARYETQAACLAETERALLGSADADYPVIVAQCRVANEAPKRLAANDVQRPGPDAPRR